MPTNTHSLKQPARGGRLGVCRLCKQPVITHFDTRGDFVGCLKADSLTTFDLAPHLRHVRGTQPSVRYFITEKGLTHDQPRPEGADEGPIVQLIAFAVKHARRMGDKGFKRSALNYHQMPSNFATLPPDERERLRDLFNSRTTQALRTLERQEIVIKRQE